MARGTTDRRGQTPADYLIGISLLLVTIVGVFAFVPTVFDPFEQPSNPDDRVMAERVSEDLVQANASVGYERTVNLDELNDTLSSKVDQVGTAAGIPEFKGVNATLFNGSQRVEYGGDTWFGDAAGGTSTRMIVSHQDTCASGCQLVVRVWTR